MYNDSIAPGNDRTKALLLIQYNDNCVVSTAPLVYRRLSIERQLCIAPGARQFASGANRQLPIERQLCIAPGVYRQLATVVYNNCLCDVLVGS